MKQLYICLLAAFIFASCKKGEYIDTYKEFVDVHFDARQTALQNSGEGIFIAAMYNGQPIDWQHHQFKIKVVEGEGKFEFYDTRTGKIVAEKVIDVKPGMTDTFTLFQPTMESPVTFIDPKADAGEPAAPEGHIKVKVANYAQMLIPFKKIKLNIYLQYYDENWQEQNILVGALDNVADDMNDATFQVLPKSVPDGVDSYTYTLEVVDAETGAVLQNHGSTNYITGFFSPIWMDPLPAKNVFTFYLVPNKAWGETPFFLKYGEDYYNVQANMLSYY